MFWSQTSVEDVSDCAGLGTEVVPVWPVESLRGGRLEVVVSVYTLKALLGELKKAHDAARSRGA